MPALEILEDFLELSGMRISIQDGVELLSRVSLAPTLTKLHLDGVWVDYPGLFKDCFFENLTKKFHTLQNVQSFRTPTVAGTANLGFATRIVELLPAPALACVTVLDVRCYGGAEDIETILKMCPNLWDLNIAQVDRWCDCPSARCAILECVKLKVVRVGNVVRIATDFTATTDFLKKLVSRNVLVKGFKPYDLSCEVPGVEWLSDINCSDLPDSDDQMSVALDNFTKNKDSETLQDLSREYRAIWDLQEMWKCIDAPGLGVKVALLDTGVSYTHPALVHCIKGVRTFVPGQHAWFDPNGHGTHCAGIIAGSIQDRVFGVAPEVELYVAKVLRNDGSGKPEYSAAAIDWAVDELDCDIISLSLGSKNNDPVFFTAIGKAVAKGKVIVCAAANDGRLARYTIGYPARYGSVLCVGSHTNRGQVSDFSSVGRELDFLAPGEEISSCYSTNGFRSFTGTSMATPFVTGLVALVLSYDRRSGSSRLKNVAQMRAVLRAMATSPGHHDQSRGHGILRPLRVLREKRIYEALEYDD